MERARNLSKSMLAYVKRAREHNEFILKEISEYEKGKRHLANIMGVEAQEMTQDHVDDAIKYLFPSGLFEPKARPIMKHPELIYKPQKGAQFDETGRPHHYLFYTSKPNYFDTLSGIQDVIKDMNAYEDQKLAQGILEAPENSAYNFNGRGWITYQKASDILLENINQGQYDYLINCLEKVLKHPYSIRARALLDQFSYEKPEQTLTLDLPEIHRDEASGEIYTDMPSRAGETRIQVKTVLNGSGKIDIEGMDILYFKHAYYRRALFFPLSLTGMMDKVDIYVRVVSAVQNVGQSNIAVAARYAVAKSLAAYLDEDARMKLRLSGLLTIDTRLRERKKFGQAKARRKYTWKKR